MELQEATVLLIGVGGIGSHVAVALTRAGLGSLHIVDFDVVEASNLGRQYYTQEDVGIVKVEAMKGHLHAINPSCQIYTYNEELRRDSLHQLLEQFDYVIEAVDKATTKAWMTETILTHPKRPILIGCSGMAGFGDSNGIRRQQLHDRWYVCGDGKSDIDELGKITAARVMVCAGHMANTCIQLIRGDRLE